MPASSTCCYELHLPYSYKCQTVGREIVRVASSDHDQSRRETDLFLDIQLIEPSSSSVASPELLYTVNIPQSLCSSSSDLSPDPDQSPVEAVVVFLHVVGYRYERLDEEGNSVVYDWEVEHDLKLAHFEFSLFKSYDSAFSKLSEGLSNMGINSERHVEILRDAVRYYGKMSKKRTPGKCVSFRGRRLKIILFYLQGCVLRHSHDQCLTARTGTGIAQSESDMVPACQKAVEEQVNRVDMSCDRTKGLVGTTCSICLQKFNVDGNTNTDSDSDTEDGTREWMATMPCSHVFHEKCILQWLNKSHCCPLCRFKIQFEPGTHC